MLPAVNSDSAQVATAETKDGRTVTVTTATARSAWGCQYGWLVDDIVGTSDGDASQAGAMSRCHWRWLIANVVFLIHVAVLSALMGLWADQEHASIQLWLLIGVKTAYSQ